MFHVHYFNVNKQMILHYSLFHFVQHKFLSKYGLEQRILFLCLERKKGFLLPWKLELGAAKIESNFYKFLWLANLWNAFIIIIACFMHGMVTLTINHIIIAQLIPTINFFDRFFKKPGKN